MSDRTVPAEPGLHLSAEDCAEQIAALLQREDLAPLTMAEEAMRLIRAATPWTGSPEQAETLARSVAQRLGDPWVSVWMPAY